MLRQQELLAVFKTIWLLSETFRQSLNLVCLRRARAQQILNIYNSEALINPIVPAECFMSIALIESHYDFQ